jgi:molybdenum cofactor guanylyltransferase
MRTLGIVLAGGMSHRFGSDKAEAMFDGRSLLDHTIAALRPHCDTVAIVGRSIGGEPAIEDWPEPGQGPLGGLAGALAHAADHGFAQVLSVPVDCIFLPLDIRDALEPAPAYLESQPVIGLWPVASRTHLERMLTEGDKRAVRAFADRIGARAVATRFAPPNGNTPDDLARLLRTAASAP